MAENDIEALAVEQVAKAIHEAHMVEKGEIAAWPWEEAAKPFYHNLARAALTTLRSATAAKDAEIAAYREALEKIERTPAWGYPDKWETTPAEVRQLARAALTNRGEAGALAKERGE